MRYINRDLLFGPSKYYQQLHEFDIDIRGTLHRDDIYFDAEQVSRIFGTSCIKYSAWIIDSSGEKFKFMTYADLIELFKLKAASAIDINHAAFRFVSLINMMLDDEVSSSGESDWEEDIFVELSSDNEHINVLNETIEIQSKEIEYLKKELSLAKMYIEILKKNSIIAEPEKKANVQEAEGFSTRSISELPSQWI